MSTSTTTTPSAGRFATCTNAPLAGVLASFKGNIVMIGFGSIARAVLPLLERHLEFDRSKLVVVDPTAAERHLLDSRGVRLVQVALTQKNHREVLTPLLTGSDGRALLINLSVDVSSAEVIDLCQELNVHYIDTVCEPWPGIYKNVSLTQADRTNYVMREEVRARCKKGSVGTTSMVSCCGANPGMISWFAKQALLNLAADLGLEYEVPVTRQDWAQLMHRAGVKGIHIAERDSQRARHPKPPGVFINTWSVEGFWSEGLQPAELGWGTHEKSMPANGHRHTSGCEAAIYLDQPGAGTHVRTWTPTAQAHLGFLVTHNEAISISDYFTVRDDSGAVVYRPTSHYAYHPCNDTILSIHEMSGNAWQTQPTWKILHEEDILDGSDELGVLLYGHGKNAYWYGSMLSIEQTRKLAPHQNATGLQVSSAVLAGIIWMLENPNQGLVETESMDFKRCLEVQMPYLGDVVGIYTDWTPLTNRPGLFAEELDREDPWQFRNVIV